MVGRARHRTGRFITAALAAVLGGALTAALLGAATAMAVSASGFATPGPAPAAGVASYSELSLGPSWLEASCLAMAPDGSGVYYVEDDTNMLARASR